MCLNIFAPNFIQRKGNFLSHVLRKYKFSTKNCSEIFKFTKIAKKKWMRRIYFEL